MSQPSENKNSLKKIISPIIKGLTVAAPAMLGLYFIYESGILLNPQAFVSFAVSLIMLREIINTTRIKKSHQTMQDQVDALMVQASSKK